jgi:hypothetical protein
MNLKENISRIKEVMGIYESERETLDFSKRVEKKSGEKWIKCKNCNKKFTQTIHKGKKSLPICPHCGTDNSIFSNEGKEKINEIHNSEETNTKIEKLLRKLKLPHVVKTDVSWNDDQGMYKVKLYYNENEPQVYDFIEKNESKVRGISKILELPRFSFAVSSYHTSKDIQEQVPDSRFSNNSNKEKSIVDTDDATDVVSAVLDAIPGIGNLLSSALDLIHALTYLFRFFKTSNEDEKIEYGSLALITLGTTLIPGSGAVNMAARNGIKSVLRYTPVEIMELGQKLGLVNKTRFFLSKSRWKYSILLVLAKLFRGELSEFISTIIIKLKEITKRTKKNLQLNSFSTTLENTIALLEEFKADADTAVKLTQQS